MNTVDDLRQVLSEQVRRLQPQAGLETRILRLALAETALHRSDPAPRRRPFTAATRATGVMAAVLIIVLVVAAILVGGRIWPVPRTVPGGHPTRAIPRADSGMVTATVGWAGGAGRPVIRTTDAGAHWAEVDPPSFSPSLASSTYFLDSMHAWVATTSQDTPLKLITFGTTDGGKTWHQGAAVSVTAIEGVQGGLPTSMYFLDALDGWLLFWGGPVGVVGSTLVASTFLYGTKDGGLHWTLLAVNPVWSDSLCRWIGAAFSSVNDGWLAVSCAPGFTNAMLVATHDGGITWSSDLPVNGPGCPCTADIPVVFDKDHAAVLVHGSVPDSPPQLFITSNSAFHWNARTLPGQFQLVVEFIDAQHGWAVAGPMSMFFKTSKGFPDLPGVTVPLYRTDDGGLTWVSVQTNLPLASSSGRVFNVYFVDAQNGFADRFDVATQQGQLLRTTNGGRTWTVAGPEPFTAL